MEFANQAIAGLKMDFKWISCSLIVPKRLLLQHWKDKHMAPYTQWTEDLIAFDTYEWSTYKTCLDKYNKTWDSFLQNIIG